ncbi:hypothetical protein FQN50_005704 [Emmonsiellopsis sp. PD_5]|nr:hypothetical protein FQN50_005704 [Emmonsiellopsis sp. PD_5]
MDQKQTPRSIPRKPKTSKMKQERTSRSIPRKPKTSKIKQERTSRSIHRRSKMGLRDCSEDCSESSQSDSSDDSDADDSKPASKVKRAPQKIVDKFWDSFDSKHPGRVVRALPRRKSKAKTAQPTTNIAHGEAVTESYNRAKAECEHAVNRIVKECLRMNQKYTDPHFDIEEDLKSGTRNCLDGILNSNFSMQPKGVRRVTDIFEKPEFYKDDATGTDVRQGNDGDCWLMAALATLGNMKGLIDRVCITRNEQVGVYGFVFYRDGEWRHTIIDDKLYLRVPDWEDAADEREVWDDIGSADTQEKYRKTWQTGSRALYFAQCSDDNETWLPLLEKAYAKAHGDYSSIEGGFVGEAIEDLTGGVTSEMISRNILDKERFWSEDLMNANKRFLFGCATGVYGRWLYPYYYGGDDGRDGVVTSHAYSVMDAREIKGKRMLRLRNPWGQKEWTGPWSDGSAEWTPEWMELLGHKFGNDGMFWISYEDFLRKYEHLDRTRLFGEDWKVTQKWTTLQVPWTIEYHRTKFTIEVANESPVVIVLSQLDERYFQGLDGQYKFNLQFRLEKDGEEDYIVRNQNNSFMSRSVSADITLEPGTYTLLMKVKATRFDDYDLPELVVKEQSNFQPLKLIQIGQSYDMAHAKGVELESKEEEEERKTKEAEKKAAERKKARDKAEATKKKEWARRKKKAARERRKTKKMERVKALRKERGEGDEDDEDDDEEGDEDDGGDDEEGDEDDGGDDGEESGTEEGGESEDEGEDEEDEDTNKKEEAAGTRSEPKDDHDDSDLDSISDFEFDSEIDMSSEDESEDGDEEDEEGSSSEEEEDTVDQPWNAVCVVGLRVYAKDSDVSIRLVKPKFWEEDVEARPDCDDPIAEN